MSPNASPGLTPPAAGARRAHSGHRSSEDSGLELLASTSQDITSFSGNEEALIPAQVAVVIVMPGLDAPRSVCQVQPNLSTPLYIGVANV